MGNNSTHSFHIPVLGIGFTIDTPLKVARFGISSVISIMDDELIEQMRQHYCAQYGIPFAPIPEKEIDHRALRITAYLNLMETLIAQQMQELRALPFDEPNDLTKYFELLPQSSPLKMSYHQMVALPEGEEKMALQQTLREAIKAGSIDVNILVKMDRTTTDTKGNILPPEYSDASAGFRGFANSRLQSSIVLSAGYNPRLYNYIEQFADFFPDENGNVKKKIILKVSDYRSALVQGKVLAKKGIWISEFRIESGLNCGGHAFPTDGYLMGPILAEFKENREKLQQDLFELCQAANLAKSKTSFREMPEMRISVQGGIGTHEEHRFLQEHYGMDSIGWGSPFLLVPETTNVDETTLQQLSVAKKEDYYLSYASPLGVAFNNFRPSTAHQQIQDRIKKNRPGSPCYKKLLVSNTEFTEMPICTASREYQHLKLKQLDAMELPKEAYEIAYNKITEKDCLCEGLGASTLQKNGLPPNHKLTAVSICPGPNLAYFSGVFSLKEMVDHIYGRMHLLNALHRPNLFVNELNLYISHYIKRINETLSTDTKQIKYLQSFKANMLSGISYYQNLAATMEKKASSILAGMKEELEHAIAQIELKKFHFDLATH